MLDSLPMELVRVPSYNYTTKEPESIKTSKVTR